MKKLLLACVLLVALGLQSKMVEGHPEALFLIASADASSVTLLDALRNLQTTFIPPGSHLDHPDGMVYNPITKHLLISSGHDASTSAILQFDGTTGAYAGRFDNNAGPLARPYGLVLTPDKQFLLVSSFHNDKVLKYNVADGRYIGELPASPHMHGPNALLYAQDGMLYVTTEGSKFENGNLTYPYPSQILRLRGETWEVFADDAKRYASPNRVLGASFLGLANSNVKDDGLLFVTDFSNGILAFELATGKMVARVETSFTGLPAYNGIGSLIFETKGPEESKYSILTPAFLPLEKNIGAVLRTSFNTTSSMPNIKPTIVIPPYVAPMKKPITIIRYAP